VQLRHGLALLIAVTAFRRRFRLRGHADLAAERKIELRDDAAATFFSGPPGSGSGIPADAHPGHALVSGRRIHNDHRHRRELDNCSRANRKFGDVPQAAAARRLRAVRTFGRWDCINARQRERAKESRIAASPSLLTSPATCKPPRNCGAFHLQPRGAPLRQTRRWRRSDSNSRSHLQAQVSLQANGTELTGVRERCSRRRQS
jgi:hypothetical protein